MKKLLYLLTALIYLLTHPKTDAQTTAFDWTRSECETAENVHLFEQLNAGKVIILDFVMIPNCGWCIWASKYLKEVVAPYEISHPDRVKVYMVGFDNAYTCQQLTDWKKKFNLVEDGVFAGGSDETNYYGGMGMPTVVVVGGSDHRVFYNNLGFLESDTAAASLAIRTALKTVTAAPAPDDEAAPALLLLPNPAVGEVRVNLASGVSTDADVRFDLLDCTGRLLTSALPDSAGGARFSVAQLPSGIYSVRCRIGSRIFHKKLIVNQQ